MVDMTETVTDFAVSPKWCLEGEVRTALLEQGAVVRVTTAGGFLEMPVGELHTTHADQEIRFWWEEQIGMLICEGVNTPINLHHEIKPPYTREE